MIEEIVKLNLPILGSGERMLTKDGKHVRIPRPLCKILELRQEKRSCKNCIAYIAVGKNPVLATITDVPGEVEGENHEYNKVNISEFGMILLPEEVYREAPIDRKITFIGRENYIEVRASNAYDED
jgi:hypothetical protein